jgi:hypothetical protein
VGTYQPCVCNLPLDEWIVNTKHKEMNQKQKKNREIIQMTKSQLKAKTGSFKMSKGWSPKTWAMARRNQVKQLVLKKRQIRAQHH